MIRAIVEIRRELLFESGVSAARPRKFEEVLIGYASKKSRADEIVG